MVNKWIDGCINEQMAQQVDGWQDGCMQGWLGQQVDGWQEGWIGLFKYL